MVHCVQVLHVQVGSVVQVPGAECPPHHLGLKQLSACSFQLSAAAGCAPQLCQCVGDSWAAEDGGQQP